jgi:hypothetical protein
LRACLLALQAVSRAEAAGKAAVKAVRLELETATAALAAAQERAKKVVGCGALWLHAASR